MHGSWSAGDSAPSKRPETSTTFFAAFCLCSIALFSAASLAPETLFNPLSRHTALMAAAILELCGFQPATHPLSNGTALGQGAFTVGVITECTALYLWILFGSFVAAYPVQLRLKLPGLVLGASLLHAGNVLRVAAVFAVGVKYPPYFEAVHALLGQVLMVLLVIAVCLAWTRMVSTDAGSSPSAAAFLLRLSAVSALPFLFWLRFNVAYVRLTDRLVRSLFSPFGVHLEISYQHLVYFQTFNLVTFSGLVLATRRELVRRKLWTVAAGFAVIVGAHLLFRICNVLCTGFGVQAASPLSNTVSILGQYLLPLIFWLLLLSGDKSAPSDLQGAPNRNRAL